MMHGICFSILDRSQEGCIGVCDICEQESALYNELDTYCLASTISSAGMGLNRCQELRDQMLLLAPSRCLRCNAFMNGVQRKRQRIIMAQLHSPPSQDMTRRDIGEQMVRLAASLPIVWLSKSGTALGLG